MNKKFFLDLAEVLDALRVMPRSLLLAAYIFSFHYINEITQFYLNSPEKTTELTAFAAIVIPGITGILSMLTTAYFKSGRKWNEDS